MASLPLNGTMSLRGKKRHASFREAAVVPQCFGRGPTFFGRLLRFEMPFPPLVYVGHSLPREH